MNERLRISSVIMQSAFIDRQMTPQQHAARALELADALIAEEKATQPKKKSQVVKAEETTVLVIPTNRFETEGETFAVTDQMIHEWQQTFPGVDVPAEVQVAKTWCMDNREKRKTMGGMRRFLGSWLKRAQDRGGNRASHNNSTRGVSLEENLSDTSWADS